MTVMTHEPSADTPIRQDIASRLLVPGFWATVSIVTMWLAVLFDGIFGGDMTFTNSSSEVTVMPSVVAVALFAAIATASVAKRAFGRLYPEIETQGGTPKPRGLGTKGSRDFLSWCHWSQIGWPGGPAANPPELLSWDRLVLWRYRDAQP